MLSQDQYHDSLTNRRQRPGTGFESLVKASMPKPLPMEPDNDTNTKQTSDKVADNDPSLKTLNWNNIKNIRREDFKKLFEGLKKNTHLESLSLANTDLTDSLVKRLVEAVRQNKTLKSLNVESNYISGPTLKDLVAATNVTQTLEELRASNQRPMILGNKIEMEIARLVEKNRHLLRLGISFDVPDARMRVTQHLQNNYDRREFLLRGCTMVADRRRTAGRVFRTPGLQIAFRASRRALAGHECVVHQTPKRC
ncbi:hypothetical protein HPB47_026656 [Ixodes persulcatus]|uniref:Uncharacterized protein n=1 Tax=Ixodes persulcatus TaxID=34615 RepID=A0AC60PYH7_IXOPE|nr:hypothetical protein HPB47_026656 [Ixodes persulcatus]